MTLIIAETLFIGFAFGYVVGNFVGCLSEGKRGLQIAKDAFVRGVKAGENFR